ncbi:MAG: protein-L-isoaspartate(D-aspartate) O-methyltransferase [Xanthomonadales bacterium]
MTSQGTRDRLVRRLRDKGIEDERVLHAIATTPRHEFVDEALSSRSYEDTALPIGLGQTISQPWVVAKMTEAMLDGGSPQKVLEVGTGSGYQAAILAALVPQVFTVERIEELLKIARRRFHRLKLNNIYTRHADGHLGWPSQAPFDGIIVTAAASRLPLELVTQLRVGGVLVAPVERGGMQRLLAVRRTEDGHEERDLGGVIFVPLLAGLS